MNLSELKAERSALKRETEELAIELQNRQSEVQKRVDEIWAEFKQANIELFKVVDAAQSLFDAKDTELRAAVVAAWPGGNAPKTVADGLSVRVNTKLVYDEGAAIRWAIEKNLPDLLKLDATKFKKAAEALKPSFVVEESSITAVIKE